LQLLYPSKSLNVISGQTIEQDLFSGELIQELSSLVRD